MKNIDIARALEVKLGTMVDVTIKPTTYESQYWLNEAVIKFIKTRYSGTNALRKGFEQNQKRVEDLKRLIVTIDVVPTKQGIEYTTPYPADCMIVLGENVKIFGTNQTEVDAILADVFECTIENVTRRQTNRLTDVQYHNGYARPARLFEADNVRLITDGNYNISKYTLSYLKYPTKIDILQAPQSEYSDLDDTALTEVVALAVQMYAVSKNDPRYNAISNEINTME